jgi:recombination protein RecT
MGYKGLAELFYRHEKAVQLDWGIVHENDDFRYEYGTNAFLKHIPAQNDPGVAIGYYVIAKLNGGGRPFMYMTKTDCMDHGKKHSKTYDKNEGKFYASSPWATSEDSMCLKTVLIQLAKLLPLSMEMQRALEADETSREYRTGIDDAMDIPANTNWDKEEKEPEKEKPFDPEKMDPKKDGELI